MKNFIKYIVIITILIACLSCDSSYSKINLKNDKWKNYETIRLDKNLLSAKNTTEIHQAFIKYPQLYQNFYSRMLRAGDMKDVQVEKLSKQVKEKLDQFKSDTVINNILKEIQKEFDDFEYYKLEIAKGLSRYETIFNFRYKSQKIGTFFSLFNADVVEFDSIIWIGLDMYIGPENRITKLIRSESLPQYIKDKMDKKYIVSDVLFGYLMTHNYQYMGDDLLSKILSYGKIAYLMDLILPDEDPENKFRYNANELKWCGQNEKYIWQHIIDEELLYEKDLKKINSFFSPGPYTKNFGKDSPSHIGIWLGYRMIQDYSEKNNLSIKEILLEKNIQKLLSAYEPK